MRTASSNLTAHLAGEVTSLAICWKLTLVDNTVLGFTDHTADLVISSITYKAATGISPSSIGVFLGKRGTAYHDLGWAASTMKLGNDLITLYHPRCHKSTKSDDIGFIFDGSPDECHRIYILAKIYELEAAV